MTSVLKVWPVALFLMVGHAAAAPIPVVCSLDHSVVTSQQPVTATALVDDRDPALHYTWVADSGTLSSNGRSTIQWNPNEIPSGSYHLTLTVTDSSAGSGTCSLEVIVESEKHNARGPASAPGGPGGGDFDIWRTLLIKDDKETPGYGLYSYLILAPTAGPDRERDKRLVEAYLTQIVDIQKLDAHLKTAQLNLTYLPVDQELPERIEKTNEIVDWILEHYDYGRGRLILRSVPGASGDGPFIISAMQPLPGQGGPYLVEDLSGKPPSVIDFWMNEFRSQTSQQRSWEKKTMDTVALNLRTALAVGAEGLPMVQKAVAAWVVMSK